MSGVEAAGSSAREAAGLSAREAAAAESRPALIAEVKGNSLDDGPGIRSVVFFKGCPLDCAWCHNPETKRRAPEIAFDRERCRGTLRCVAVCEPRALDRASADFVNRDRCTLCGACVGACPSGALEIVGRALDVEEILATAARFEVFYRTSGGGVTLSGGEPLLFPDESGAVLRRLKERGIHTLVETCGLFSLDRYTALVEPHVDQVYFDLKIIDDAEHRLWCGTSNRTILANFRELHRRSREGGVPVLPRVPLVPDFTATEANLRAIAAFLREEGAGDVALLPYNPLWGSKAGKVGAPVRVERATWMSPEEIARCRAAFAGFRLAS